jgi:uncharacterized membrane protein YgdD (TMEM256/DUF423 family)
MRSPTIIALGAVSGFISVAAGAFGAHALKAQLTPDLLSTFEVGARYQMYHALLLVLIGVVVQTRGPSESLSISAGLLVAGTALFSGSLYALALSGQRWFGAITPLGGFCFLLGWLALAYAALRSP